jgi:flagella basal body P-ring formation protein FlgA
MMLFFLAAAACIAVNPQADRIFARDLAPQFPALAQAPEGAIASFAPAPGAIRAFPPGELVRLAARFGISASPQNEICVERPVSVLEPAALLQAMRAVLPAAQIALVDFSRAPAPAGPIEFRLADLHPGPPEGAYWRGSVHYAANRQFSIWAKLKVSVPATRVTAIGDLPPGEPIAAGLVTVRTEAVFPSAREFATSIEEVAGKMPRILIRAGSDISLEELGAAKDVTRGDPVKVDVSIGAARIELDAVAETSGSIGARIQVRNPATNKTFSARVEAKGRASVDASSRKNNL